MVANATKTATTTLSRHILHKKNLVIVRHGQALHNPRAEAAKDAGCSHSHFLELMRQDDAFDAPLTKLGEGQARECGERYRSRLSEVELVVASPLSRALRTADLVCPPAEEGEGGERVCVEGFREISGWLMNAKRRNRSDLNKLLPHWDFSLLTETDKIWTKTLESENVCAERGYQSLIWLTKQPQHNLLVVCHGGLLRFLMMNHPKVKMVDRRAENEKRFGNCELREYEMSWREGDDEMDIVLTELGRGDEALEDQFLNNAALNSS